MISYNTSQKIPERPLLVPLNMYCFWLLEKFFYFTYIFCERRKALTPLGIKTSRNDQFCYILTLRKQFLWIEESSVDSKKFSLIQRNRFVYIKEHFFESTKLSSIRRNFFFERISKKCFFDSNKLFPGCIIWECISFMWKMTFEIFIKSLRFVAPWVRKNVFYESFCLCL